MKILKLAPFALVLFCSSAWAAIDSPANNALYGSLAGSLALTNASTINENEGSSLYHTFSSGAGLLGAVGYQFTYFAVEGELGYLYNSVSKTNFYDHTVDLSTTTGNGYINASLAMVNGYFRYANASPFTPYVGVGLGGAFINRSSNMSVGGERIKMTAGYPVFAYQGIIGLGYTITPVWSVNVDYRYVGTPSASFSVNDFRNSGARSATAGFSTNLISLGFTYHLV